MIVIITCGIIILLIIILIIWYFTQSKICVTDSNCNKGYTCQSGKCISPPEVYMYEPIDTNGYDKFTADQAKDFVNKNNLKLADLNQLKLAQVAGAQTCALGLLSDGYAYPMQHSVDGCGDYVGVIEDKGGFTYSCTCNSDNDCKGGKCMAGKCNGGSQPTGCGPMWLYGVKPPPSTPQIKPFYNPLTCNIQYGCDLGSQKFPCTAIQCSTSADCGDSGICTNGKCTAGNTSGTCFGNYIWSEYDQPKKNGVNLEQYHMAKQEGLLPSKYQDNLRWNTLGDLYF
jgi:hypothetical protein